MTAGEICNREIIVIQRDESVLEAARLMRQYHVGSLIVIDRTGGCAKPVGIITDRDLVVEVLATGLDESVVTWAISWRKNCLLLKKISLFTTRLISCAARLFAVCRLWMQSVNWSVS
ncbi:CBS domain-containing protein [uncultured Nitrosomonas sp.]|uniref:CBS domain-containing protein n=1 Tax=uncultured Nitrosomonas sp. TaxID=156424 RepID=UPI00342A3888